MRDYFAYNGEDVIPNYMPGVPSYGQEGSEGNTGEKGSSVYYTSYTLPNDLILCNDKIASNKLLSNNLNEDAYNEYMEGDLVIDSIGNIYKIESIKGTLMIVINPNESRNSTAMGGEIFTNFECKIISSLLPRSSYPCNIENPNLLTLDNLENFNTCKLYYSKKLNPSCQGNWIAFSIEMIGTSDNDFVYYFNLVLPNGEVLTNISYNPYAVIFVENRYFYGCFGCAETNINFNNDIKKIFGVDVTKKLSDKNINDLINYISFDNNYETNNYVSVLMSYYIHKYCTAYVEVCNNNTGKIYRYELSEITLDIDTSSIHPFSPHVSWDYEQDSSYQGLIPEPNLIETETSIIYYRTFKKFITYPSRDNNERGENIENISSATYNFIQDFFYIDENGLNLPPGYNSDSDYLDYIYDDYDSLSALSDITHSTTPLALWLANDITSKSSTIKIEFKNTKKFSLNIRFNQFEKNGVLTMPHTMVYVSYPNIHLWQEGDENGNVELPNSSAQKTEESVKENKKAYDGSTGVYYIYKIIPYGLELNDETDTASIADAGLSIITLDLSYFDLDLTKSNWIEIGAMTFGENKNYEHRPSIFPLGIDTMENASSDENYAKAIDEHNLDIRDCLVNSNILPNVADDKRGRYSLGNTTWENVCYSFAYMTDDNRGNIREAQRTDTNQCKNIYADAGLPDVTLYINNIVELDTIIKNETKEITPETNDTVYVNYVEHGMMWDSSTYTVIKKQAE